jgi:hypothetical protein
MAFDAPSREVACERRIRSNTPVQSLVTLNDPAFVAAANGLARLTVEQGGDTFESRLDFALMRALSRLASSDERDAFGRLYAASRARFEAEPESGARLIKVGLPNSDPTNVVELATWSVLANVILNLDEALSKG